MRGSVNEGISCVWNLFYLRLSTCTKCTLLWHYICHSPFKKMSKLQWSKMWIKKRAHWESESLLPSVVSLAFKFLVLAFLRRGLLVLLSVNDSKNRTFKQDMFTTLRMCIDICCCVVQAILFHTSSYAVNKKFHEKEQYVWDFELTIWEIQVLSFQAAMVSSSNRQLHGIIE